MKHSKEQALALLMALALALTLLAGCGGGNAQQSGGNDGDRTPVQIVDDTGAEEPDEPVGTDPADLPLEDDGKEEEEEAPAAPEDDPQEEPSAPEESAGGPDASEEQQSEAQEAEPPAEPEPEPEPDVIYEDGLYTANVTLEGGTGRATVESPAQLRCENGQFFATIIWSSSSYDYMKVEGEKYLQTNTEGNSTFEIPVAAFDEKLDVAADTVAMSEPHEIEYTLYFDSSTLQKQ